MHRAHGRAGAPLLDRLTTIDRPGLSQFVIGPGPRWRSRSCRRTRTLDHRTCATCGRTPSSRGCGTRRSVAERGAANGCGIGPVCSRQWRWRRDCRIRVVRDRLDAAPARRHADGVDSSQRGAVVEMFEGLQAESLRRAVDDGHRVPGHGAGITNGFRWGGFGHAHILVPPVGPKPGGELRACSSAALQTGRARRLARQDRAEISGVMRYRLLAL
jgi:hypothetical protein